MSESEQNLAGQQIHEEKLRRYLLGQCSAVESAEIEQAAFRDNNVSDALSVIEDELTEDYVSDQLNDFDRSCFELKFLSSSERREKVRLSALLLTRAEVLRRVPPSFVRAHQLMSQEMKEAFEGTEEMFYMNEPETGGDRDALDERMPASIPTAPGSAARRWKRWIVLGAVAGLLLVVLYGVRVRLSLPVLVLNPAPSIASVTFAGNEPQEVQHLNFDPALLQSATLIVTGTNFTKGAIVQWNGSNLQTEFVNATVLLATIPGADLLTRKGARVQVIVVNPPPGGGPSRPVILSPTPEK